MQEFKKSTGKGNRTGKGYFEIRGKEPLAKRMTGARLPESIDVELRQLVGHEYLTDWVRSALIKQFELEKAKSREKKDA